MKRYLVVFITEGQFACEVVQADDLADAYKRFTEGGLAFDEVYSVTRAA